MRRIMLLLVCFLLVGDYVVAQQDRPQIRSITVLPSEPVVPSGDCTSSTAGYLEINNKSKLTDKQIGSAISKYLRHGYIVTAYPATQRGIFVALQCTNTATSEAK